MSWQIDLYTDYDWTDDSYTTHYDLMDYSGDNISIASGFRKTEVLHKDGKPVLNKAQFSVQLKTSMANDLLTLDYDSYVYCTITKDASAWFTGFARPVTSWTVDQTNGVIQFEVVDTTYMLKRNPADALSKTSTDNMDVCSTGTPAESMVNYILTDADWDFGTSLFNITDPIEYYLEKDKTYYDLLADLLFSYHCTFYADASGQFCLYDWAPDSISVDRTYNDANIMEGFEVNRDDSDNDGCEVTWYETETEGDAKLYSYDVYDGTFIRSGGTPRWPADDGDAETNETLFEWDISRDGADIIGVSSPEAKLFIGYYTAGMGGGSVGYWPAILTEAGDGANLTVTVSHDTDALNTDYYVTNGANLNVQIRNFWIEGDVTWKIQKNPMESPTTYENPKKIDGKYVYTSSAAKQLAQGYYHLLQYGSYKYKFRSETASSIGDYITIAETTLNISTTARVTKVITKEVVGTQLYEIEAEGAAVIGSLFGQITRGRSIIVPSTSDTVQAVQSALNGLDPSGHLTTSIGTSLLDDIVSDEAGVYITHDAIGFSDGSDWLIKIENDSGIGKLYAGDGGTTAGTNSFIQWDGADLTISGDMYLSGDSEISGSVAVGETLAVAGSITVGDHMTLDGAEVSVEITDALDNMKMIYGYMGNAPVGWVNADGNQLDGDDYGLYVAGGNMVVADGARFENGDYNIQHDAAYIIYNSGTPAVEAGRFGSVGGGLVGIRVGTIDEDAGTGSGFYADENGNALFSGTITVGSLPTLSDANLEAYWSFDDGVSGSADGATITDNSGNGHNATASGCTWTEGVSGHALDFDGADDYVRTDNTIAGFGSTVSFSLWFRYDSSDGNGGDVNILFDKYDTGYGAAAFLNDAGTTINLRYGSYIDSVTGLTLGDDVFHHIVITYDGTNRKLYIDGLLDSTDPCTDTDAIDTYIYLGSRGGSSYFTNITIDEPRIYSRALSASEVKYLYLNPGGNSGRTVISGNQITTGTFTGVNINLNDVFQVDGTTGIITYNATEVELGNGADASGTNSVAIGNGAGGDGTASSGDYSVAVGDSADYATATQGTAVGYVAESTGDYSTAIGSGARATALRTTAIGYTTNVSSAGSTALGYGAFASDQDGVALGRGAGITEDSAIAIGYGADGDGTYAVAIGRQADASSLSAVAIGYGSSAGGPTPATGKHAQFDLNTNDLNLTAFYFASGTTHNDIYDALYAKCGNLGGHTYNVSALGQYGTTNLRFLQWWDSATDFYRVGYWSSSNLDIVNNSATTISVALKLMVLY